MSKSISIFDTTLRDGTQGEGISLSADDKVKIAKKLDALGVHYIEGGIPGSNSKDIEFFKRVQDLGLTSKVTAFGSTRRKGSIADQDANLLRILNPAFLRPLWSGSHGISTSIPRFRRHWKRIWP